MIGLTPANKLKGSGLKIRGLGFCGNVSECGGAVSIHPGLVVLVKCEGSRKWDPLHAALQPQSSLGLIAFLPGGGR